MIFEVTNERHKKQVQVSSSMGITNLLLQFLLEKYNVFSSKYKYQISYNVHGVLLISSGDMLRSGDDGTNLAYATVI